MKCHLRYALIKSFKQWKKICTPNAHARRIKSGRNLQIEVWDTHEELNWNKKQKTGYFDISGSSTRRRQRGLEEKTKHKINQADAMPQLDVITQKKLENI